MPRVKSDSTITHRVEFSPVERKLIGEIQEQMKTDRLFKRGKMVAQGVGFVALPLGVGIAAYAFWRWAGLGSIVEDTKNAIMDFGEWGGHAINDNILAPIGLDLEQFIVGEFEASWEGLQAFTEECNTKIKAQQEILNSTTASENQIAQATMNIKELQTYCAKEMERRQKQLYEAFNRSKCKTNLLTDLLNPFTNPSQEDIDCLKE